VERLARLLGSRISLVLVAAIAGFSAQGVMADNAISIDDCIPGGEEPPPPPPPPEERLFAPTSFWNAPLADDAEVDPKSPDYVAKLKAEVDRVYARRDGPWMATRQYSTPLYKVPADQPTVKVTIDYPPPQYLALQAALDAVPIPPGATPAAGTDGHMTIWQPSTGKLWELWKASKAADGSWHARWGGAIRDVHNDPGYYTESTWEGSKPFWGASATSLPVIGGTMRIDELKAGRIDHAIHVSIPSIRSLFHTPPAQRTEGTTATSGAIIAGSRFRLDPSLDVESLPLTPFVKMIARAVQRYGLVIGDKSTSVQFYGEDYTPTGSNPYPEIVGPNYPSNYYRDLARFPWEHLKLLKMDIRTNYPEYADVTP
jgi:hypothetical protein